MSGKRPDITKYLESELVNGNIKRTLLSFEITNHQ